MPSIHKLWAVAVLATATMTSGCGASSHGIGTTTGSGTTAGSTAKAQSAPVASTSTSASAGSPGALSAEARSAATGDIPDNQVFLMFHNGSAGYSIKYPEGWTQQGAGGSVTFKDKNNLVHVTVGHGATPTPASVASQLAVLRRSTPTLAFSAPHLIRLGASPVVKATYTTRSAADPVTGRRVTLVVDRYELSRNGRLAVVDLGTPRGVDNVDAYRMMIESFRWR